MGPTTNSWCCSTVAVSLVGAPPSWPPQRANTHAVRTASATRRPLSRLVMVSPPRCDAFGQCPHADSRAEATWVGTGGARGRRLRQRFLQRRFHARQRFFDVGFADRAGADAGPAILAFWAEGLAGHR